MVDYPTMEIPPAMREMAEQNMKQAHAAYEQLTDFVTHAMDNLMGAMPETPVSAGFKGVQTRAMDFAKENADTAFSFAAKVCNAQTLPEILALQTQFAQDRMKAFTSHTQELYGLIGEAFQRIQRG